MSIDMTLPKWAIFTIGLYGGIIVLSDKNIKTLTSIDMTLPKWAIFTMGVYGGNICILSDPAESSFLTT